MGLDIHITESAIEIEFIILQSFLSKVNIEQTNNIELRCSFVITFLLLNKI